MSCEKIEFFFYKALKMWFRLQSLSINAHPKKEARKVLLPFACWRWNDNICNDYLESMSRRECYKLFLSHCNWAMIKSENGMIIEEWAGNLGKLKYLEVILIFEKFEEEICKLSFFVKFLPKFYHFFVYNFHPFFTLAKNSFNYFLNSSHLA